jgi:release factor glutamine methyltransferase
VDARRLLARAAGARRDAGASRAGCIDAVTAATSVRALLAAGAARLPGDEPARDAEVLVAHALRRDRAWLYAHANDVLAPVDAERSEQMLRRRAAGEPVAYLVGTRGFWSLELGVTPEVLIPRPETELLVEAALQHIPQDEQIYIADIGTGSGAIALALATERPRARVLATDASAGALAVARANAQRLALDNVAFAAGDWCAALGARRFDVIVSNPPYIRSDDPHLAQGDLRFEPRAALASGADGLDAIRAIVRDAPAHLAPGGWLLLEHGFDQGAAVRELLERRGLEGVSTAADFEGRERVSSGRAPA